MNELRYMFTGTISAIGTVLLTGSMTLLNGETIYVDRRHGMNH